MRTQPPLKFVQKFRCKVHYPTLEKAVLWYNGIANGGRYLKPRKKIFGRGGRDGEYPAVCIGREKIMIHVLLKMHEIGGNIPPDCCVHHEDEDKRNALIGNLVISDRSLHQRFTNLTNPHERWQCKRMAFANGVQRAMKLSVEKPISDLPF